MTQITLYREKGVELSNNEVDCNFYNLNCHKLEPATILEGPGIKLQKTARDVTITLDIHIGSDSPPNNEFLWIVPGDSIPELILE